MSNNIESTEVSVTDSAAKRIAYLLTQGEQPGSRLRVSVNGGGCSGFQYQFDFDTAQNEDDIIIDKAGVQVIIDTTSLEFMKGASIDYVETLGAAHFSITNPQASASCGCGNSFAV